MTHSKTHPVLVGLPPAYLWLVPELLELELPVETRATCHSCAMVAAPDAEDDGAVHFHPDVRCCGYHPLLPSYVVGGILAGGGEPAALVRRRLAEGPGAGERGLGPNQSLGFDYVWGGVAMFGQEPRFRCPYWVGGELACGIWEHREAVCRTWHCRHVEGLRGRDLWDVIRDALSWVEARLTNWLVERGSPPPKEAEHEAWEAWFLWCRETLAAAPREELEALADDELAAMRAYLRDTDAFRTAPYPTLVEPALSSFRPCDGGFRVTGAATFDPMVVPPSLFAFLSQLDGERHLQEALAAAGEPATSDFTEDLLHEMLLRGILQQPQHRGRPDAG
jgi:hypothetical protein